MNRNILFFILFLITFNYFIIFIEFIKFGNQNYILMRCRMHVFIVRLYFMDVRNHKLLIIFLIEQLYYYIITSEPRFPLKTIVFLNMGIIIFIVVEFKWLINNLTLRQCAL